MPIGYLHRYMTANIVPLIKLSRRLSAFDYNIPSNLRDKVKTGQLVEIPFRNQEIKGIISSVQNTHSNPLLKSILRIVDKEVFLNEPQLELTRWASFYYCASQALLIRNIIPEMPKRAVNTLPIYQEIPLKKLTIPKINLSSITKILAAIEQKNKTLFHWSEPKNKIAVYIKLLEKFSDTGHVILIIPQLNQITEFLKYLPQALRNRTSILHGELNKSLYWHQFDKIRRNKSQIIIGTRHAIFAPVNNLKMIIIDDEHNQSHKQWDQNPRYHSLKLAVKLQDITQSKLLISSHAPSIETCHFALNSGYEIITEQSGPREISIINMSDEWKNKNFSILSEKAAESLKKNMADKKISIVYINRRGTGKFAICQDCKYIPLCPNCHLALSLRKSESSDSLELICYHCQHREPLQIPCPKCQSTHIKYSGTGTEKAEADLKKFFPDMRILRVDTDSISGNKKTKNSFNAQNADAIIGTNALFSFNLPTGIGSILVLNIDTNLQIPSFKAFENTFQTINQLKLLTDSQLFSSSPIIIQTFSEQNNFLKILSSNDYSEFYKMETNNRKMLHYPPFCQLIKLTLKHKNSNMIKMETERILGLLNEQFSRDMEIDFFESKGLIMKFKKYVKEIIIKNRGAHNNLQEWLIKNMPAECIIDIDPIEI